MEDNNNFDNPIKEYQARYVDGKVIMVEVKSSNIKIPVLQRGYLSKKNTKKIKIKKNLNKAHNKKAKRRMSKKKK